MLVAWSIRWFWVFIQKYIETWMKRYILTNFQIQYTLEYKWSFDFTNCDGSLQILVEHDTLRSYLCEGVDTFFPLCDVSFHWFVSFFRDLIKKLGTAWNAVLVNAGTVYLDYLLVYFFILRIFCYCSHYLSTHCVKVWCLEWLWVTIHVRKLYPRLVDLINWRPHWKSFVSCSVAYWWNNPI